MGSALDALIYGYRYIKAALVLQPQRDTINFGAEFTVTDDSANKCTTIGSPLAAAVSVSGETITNKLDTKLTPSTPLNHISTSAVTLATLYTFALAGITGVANIVARIDVTDAAGLNVGTYFIDADFRLVSGTPTLIYPASLAAAVTSRGKNGSIAGTEVSLAISSTNVLVQVTPPSSTTFTWTVHLLTQTSVP